jgi:hypothetical protein
LSTFPAKRVSYTFLKVWREDFQKFGRKCHKALKLLGRFIGGMNVPPTPVNEDPGLFFQVGKKKWSKQD